MRKIVEKSMLGKVWTISDDICKQIDSNDTQALIKSILQSRGVIQDDDIARFLNPSIKEYMPDPFVLRDMDKAVSVIADAICAGNKIAIYGDYDVDGITATAIFVKYLKTLGCDVSWHLPTREGEGYGLNINAIEKIAESGVNLLITVDCGISGMAEVARAKELGLRVVVTDHHSPDVVLPNADAVVNPKRSDDTSGLSFLAGVGVAFLTLVALNRELKNRQFFDEKINLLYRRHNMYNIAIDGPAGAGKSTIAKEVSKRLGFIYVDTGAMYRAMALSCLRAGVDVTDEAAVTATTDKADVKIAYKDGSQIVLLNGEDVSTEIRKEEVGKNTSKIAVYGKVREKLTALQKELAASSDVVMDGRDIGTSVLPNADLKIFLTASVETRAKRRYDELVAKGETPDLKVIEEDIVARDYNDSHREISPLTQAEDAILVDSSNMTIEEVVTTIIDYTKK